MKESEIIIKQLKTFGDRKRIIIFENFQNSIKKKCIVKISGNLFVINQ